MWFITRNSNKKQLENTTRFKKNEKSFEVIENFKIIYRENFQRDLKLLIEDYRKSIVNGDDFDGIPSCELRENFISKFDHICKQS